MLRLTVALQNNFLLLCLSCLIYGYTAADELDCISIQKTSGIRKDLKDFFEQSLQVISYNQNPRVLNQSYPDQCKSKIETDILINSAQKLIFFSLVSIEANVRILTGNYQSISFTKNITHTDGGIPLGMIELLINTFKIHNINIDETIEMNLFKLSRKIIEEITQKNLHQVIHKEKIVYNWDQLFINKNIDKKHIPIIEDLILKKDYENALLLIQQRIKDGEHDQEPFYLMGVVIANELNQPIIALKLYETVLATNASRNIINDYLHHAVLNGLSSHAFKYIQEKNITLDQLDNESIPLFMEIIALNDKNKAVVLFETYYQNQADQNTIKQLVIVLKRFGIWQQLKSNMLYQQIIDRSEDW